MITNSSLTIYHKEIDSSTKLETWKRLNYDEVWFFGGHGASLNKGYENANDVQIRIPHPIKVEFSIGDILVKGRVLIDIQKQSDLIGYEVYNITSINDNNFGRTPHVHIGGK